MSSAATFTDADGTIRLQGTLTTTGGGGGGVSFVGPHTVTYQDVALDPDTYGYATFATVAPGVAVLGFAWTIPTVFNDSGNGRGAIVPTDGATYGSSFDPDINLLSTTGGDDGFGGIFGAVQLGPPIIYTTAAGLNPKSATITALGTFWISAGEELAFRISSWAGDATTGEINIYIAQATITAP